MSTGKNPAANAGSANGGNADAGSPDVVLKRVYEPAGPEDGFRVLVDRLWPRGVSKEHAALDLWLKEVAPDAELREELHHEGLAYTEFAQAYRAELEQDEAHQEALQTLRAAVAEHPRVTLLYGAKDPEVNNARVLRDVLLGLGPDEQHP